MTWHKKKYTANPDIKFGRVVGKIIEDCQFEYTENPQLNGFATVMIDPNSKW